MQKTLTRSVENQITRDWQAELPSLGIYRPRHLLRRAGPLLVGVCLDRDSGADIYKPCFHVHCLGKEFPCVSLTLCQQLRSEHSGAPAYIEVKWHEQKYREAAFRMIRQCPLSLEGDLLLQQVLTAYRDHIATPLGSRQTATLYRDMIVLSAWAGDLAGAESLLLECLRRPIDDQSFQHVGGRAGFEAQCRMILAQPESIQRTVDAQINVLGVENLPVSQLRR